MYLIQILSFWLILISGIHAHPISDEPFQARVQEVPNIDDFDVLMGKKTKHWLHVRLPSDILALERYKALYEKNKGKRLLKTSLYKIPKIIHFIWLGPRPFPPQSVENIRSWMAKNPTWTFKFWMDRPRDPPCTGMERVIIQEYPFLRLGRCYHASKNWGEKSDILRYEILYNQGGVCVDHDVSCLQSFDGLHGAYDFYCGLELPCPGIVGHHVVAGNAVLGSRPGHPLVQHLMDIVEQRWNVLAQKYPGNDGLSSKQIVMERTFIALTLALGDKIDTPGNTDIVFPAAYFFAKKGMASIYSKNFLANSWASGEDSKQGFEHYIQKLLFKVDKKVSKILLFSGIIIPFNFCLIFLAYLLQRKRVVLNM